MAISKRALTLATVGLLSGSAITIGTNGIIQQDTAPPIPPVEPPAYVQTGGGRAIGGELRVEYSNEIRIRSELRYALHLDSTNRYEQVKLGEHKHVSTFVFDASISHEVVRAYQRDHAGRLPYALNIESDNRYLSPRQADLSGLNYGLQVDTQYRFNPSQVAHIASEVGYQVDIESDTRGIPYTGQNIYSHIQDSWIFVDVGGKSRAIDSGLSTYHAVKGLPFDVSVISNNRYFSQSLSKYGFISVVDAGIDIEHYSFIERAPIEVNGEEEELILLLAQFLFNDDA